MCSANRGGAVYCFSVSVKKIMKRECYIYCLCRSFYEEEEKDLTSKLWRHRNIIGYEHLLQVFSCQFVSTQYPLLDKFINEQPLLSVTKYIPEFVSLQVKLVQKSISYDKGKKVKDLYIADFLEFIQKGMLLLKLIKVTILHTVNSA